MLVEICEMQVDLSGGYYDAGDNVKYQLPMAFTITLLSWSVLEYATELQNAAQLQYALGNIVWGTDYFLKAIAGPTQLFVQVRALRQFPPQLLELIMAALFRNRQNCPSLRFLAILLPARAQQTSVTD